MQELLRVIVAGLVEDPTAIQITEDAPNEEGVIVYHLHVAPDDTGRVIGKQGRIAKAIRVIMRSGAASIIRRSLSRSTEEQLQTTHAGGQKCSPVLVCTERTAHETIP